jgi:arylsulfatase A-like enzyme
MPATRTRSRHSMSPAGDEPNRPGKPDSRERLFRRGGHKPDVSLATEFLQGVLGKNAGDGSPKGSAALFLIAFWFGIVAGWLELGLILVQGALYPHVTMEMIRTNCHAVWMIPVSDILILGVVGLTLALVACIRRDLAWWMALRLPLGLCFLTLLLTIDGLYAVASVILACGLACAIGPWVGRRALAFGRLVRVSLPLMAVSLIVLTGLSYQRVTSAEHRALSACPPAKPGAPNVLLIVLDAVRASCLSLYGHPRPTTPNLQRLASRGIVFTEARSTAPWTTPTHASIFTGRWPHELSVRLGVPLDGTFPTLAEVLGREGYATAGFVGNFYYCSASHGLGRGFARYEDAYENQSVSPFEIVWSSALGKRIVRALGYSTQLEDGVTLLRKTAPMLNRDVLGWLAARPADRPFFAFINYYDAHRPYVFQEPEPRFGTATLPAAERIEIEKRFMDWSAGIPAPPDLTAQQIVSDLCTLSHDSYDTCIAELDRHVGLLLEEMERGGLLENTLIIVTSDHGEQFGEHGTITHGTSLYRAEVHVPLLVVPPARLPAVKVVSEPVSVREIPATIAEWVNLGSRNPFPGHSLTRFLNAGTEQLHEVSPVLCQHQDNIAFPDPTKIPPACGPASSLVSRDYTYIRRDDGHEELYGLSSDPLESINLAEHPQARPVIEWFRAEMTRLCRDATSSAR